MKAPPKKSMNIFCAIYSAFPICRFLFFLLLLLCLLLLFLLLLFLLLLLLLLLLLFLLLLFSFPIFPDKRRRKCLIKNICCPADLPPSPPASPSIVSFNENLGKQLVYTFQILENTK